MKNRIAVDPNLFCVRCPLGYEELAPYVYRGESLCEKHYSEVRQWERNNDNQTIGYKP